MFFTKKQETISIPISSLISFNYTSSGGMNGGHEYLAIKKFSDNEAEISLNKQAFWNSPEEKRSVIVSIEVLKNIENILQKKKAFIKIIIPNNEVLFVHDAPSTNYHFKFDDNTNLSFDDNTILANDCYEILRTILNLLTSYLE